MMKMKLFSGKIIGEWQIIYLHKKNCLLIVKILSYLNRSPSHSQELCVFFVAS